MFYLTYRPRTIEEIDNSRVKDIFLNILDRKESLPHAFLFVGDKGTGKTSMARVFAKAVNCLSNAFSGNGKSSEPCNTCANCLAIERSASPDVTELDAASNRGIEDIKNLIHDASFLPMSSSHRIFIIDEAHMITNEAFNALLKTLEEPPKQVIFILATTNQEKIPRTILSRCTLINFGKAKKADIIRMLSRIATKENIPVDKDLMKLIADYADSSFRDAAKILEDLAVQHKLSLAEGRAYLGITKLDLLRILKEHDVKRALAWIYDFTQAGGNTRILIEHLLHDLRISLFKQKGITIDEEIEVLFNSQDTVRLMKLLSKAYADLRSSPIESLPLEIAIADFYNKNNDSNK